MSVPTYLVIDIGNTSTSLGLYRNGRVLRVQRIEKVGQSLRSIVEVLREASGNAMIDAAGIASVVPSLNPWWQISIENMFQLRPAWIDHTAPLKVKITYPKPETIGADRLANAAGAVRRYGAPVIVADFGTAVTFDLVTKREGYIGGIIAPGLPLMFDYLAERTAKLPRIGWGPISKGVGKSTAEAMQLGANWGYRGMVREILTELRRVPSLREAAICATGGFAGRIFKGVTPKPVIDPTLTLFGIGSILADMQSRQAARK